MERTQYKLKDICNIQYGYAFDSKKFSDNPNNIALIRIRDVKTGKSHTYYSGDYDNTYIVNAGDILIGMDGEFNIAKWKSEPALLNQRVCKIIPNKEVNADYLQYYLSIELKNIEARTAFVTVKHLSAKELNALKLEIHSLKKQVEIAQKLKCIEKLMDEEQEQINKYDTLIKSKFVEMFGDININNKRWDVQPLGKLCTIVRGSSPRPIEKYLGGEIPWIKIGDATDSESIYLHSTKEHIILDGVKKSRMVKAGSLIFANCGVSLGFARIITFDGCIHDGWLAMEDVDSSMDKVFLLQSLNQMTKHFREIAPAGTQPNLNTTIMKGYMQVIPPMKLQKEFISFIEQINKLKATQQKNLEKAQLLFDSLMQQYFG